MSHFKILKYIYFSFLTIGIFFTLLTTLRVLYYYIPNISMMGERTETLGFYNFWIDVLGSIASFTMVYITSLSVNLNEKQLIELKRQWEQEHSPYLSCQLIAKSGHFLLRILNSGNTTADRVNIAINSELREPKNSDKQYVPFRFTELKEFLETQEFVIPPHESLYFTICITPYKEVENLPNGYITVTLKDSLTDFGTFNLSPQNFTFASFEKENIGNSIVNAIGEVGKKIENKKFLFK